MEETIDSRTTRDRILRVDARYLMRAVPGIDQRDLQELRSTWTNWVRSTRKPSWSVDLGDVWEAFRNDHRGFIQLRATRCRACNGRLYDQKFRLGRLSPCPACHGTGRGGVVEYRLDRWNPRP